MLHRLTATLLDKGKLTLSRYTAYTKATKAYKAKTSCKQAVIVSAVYLLKINSLL